MTAYHTTSGTLMNATNCKFMIQKADRQHALVVIGQNDDVLMSYHPSG